MKQMIRADDQYLRAVYEALLELRGYLLPREEESVEEIVGGIGEPRGR